MPINKAFQRAINQTTTFIISNCLIKNPLMEQRFPFFQNSAILFKMEG